MSSTTITSPRILPLLSLHHFFLLLLSISTPSCSASIDVSAFKTNVSVDGLSTFVISVSHSFLDVVASNDQTDAVNLTSVFDLVFNGNGDIMSFLQDNAVNLLTFKVGVLVLVIIGVLFIILMPIIGFCMCCCRCCCGKCGGGERKARNKKCKRGCCGVFLFIVLILMLVTIAGSFLVSWHQNVKIKELLDNSNNGDDNILLKTVRAVEPLVDGVIVDIKDAGLSTLDDAVAEVTQAFVVVGAGIKTEIVGVVSGFGPLFDSVADIILPTYRNATPDLETILQGVADIGVNGSALSVSATELSDVIAECVTANDSACSDLDASSLVDPINVTSWLAALPKTTELGTAVVATEAAASADMSALVASSRSQMDAVGETVETTVKELNATVVNQTTVAKAMARDLLDNGLGAVTEVSFACVCVCVCVCVHIVMLVLVFLDF